MKINFKMKKIIVSGTEGALPNSRIDPCSICGRELLCTEYGNRFMGDVLKLKW